jgi:N-acetylglucosamine kinase-like BadF-type ATPase
LIFLGCDGGSTKTEWLLADETGRVLSHRIFGGCNYAFLGEEGFRALMAESIGAVLAEGGVSPAAVTAAMLGLTVYGEVPDTERTIPAAVAAALPGCPAEIANDSVAGWGGSLAGRPGINIVAGTGSVAYGRDPFGRGCRVGGWSLFFADEGSCSWVARQMIGEFVKQADGRHPRTVLYDELRRELHLTHDPYFSGYLQTEVRQNSALLAQLQPVALRAARQGDAAALDIYRRAAEELTEMASAIRAQLAFPAGEPVAVSYSGGLFRAGDVILEPFAACMERQGFCIAPPLYSPAVGTLALAAEGRLSREQTDAMLAAAAAQIARES